MLPAQSTPSTHPLWYTISISKANDPWKVVGEDKSSKQQKLKPALIAAKEKANHHPPLSFRDLGNTSISSSTLVKLNISTSFTRPNAFRKRMHNSPLKSWKPFWGQHLLRKT